MLMADVLHTLIRASNLDEATKLNLIATVDEEHAEAIDALSDEEKELRPAPVDRLAPMQQSIAVGGISQAQLDAAVAKAVAEYAKGQQTAAPAVTAPVEQTAPVAQP